MQQALLPSAFQLIIQKLELNRRHDLANLAVPCAQIYVVDAGTARSPSQALVSSLRARFPGTALLVLGRKWNEASCYAFLHLGAKGLLTYTQAREQLARALPLIASGGYWVPRAILSGFVNSVLRSTIGPRLHAEVAFSLSRRERQVLDALLGNLINKEIADRLHIPERTVKFHVSNLLRKHRVRRRGDLILLLYQRQVLSY